MTNSPSNLENVEYCSPAAVHSGMGSCLLLDVRTPVEFESVRIDGAILRPLGSINAEEITRLAHGFKEVVLICQTGGRAAKAMRELRGRLSIPVKALEGGIRGWQAAGLAVIYGESRGISLERQVRIAAGGLVLLGVVLGTWGHAGFYALSAFVGAGLVFAGVTDTCGMGLLLARMPWNQNCPAGSCKVKSGATSTPSAQSE